MSRRLRPAWPHRLGHQRGAALVAVAVGIVALTGVGVWADGPPATRPPLLTGAPGGFRTVGLPAVDAWPGGHAPTIPVPPGPSRFTAITGVGCAATAQAGYHIAYPANTVPDTRRGGWPANGCLGVFWTLPMSGTTVDDPDTYVVWWFAPAGMAGGSCDVMVYVPRPDHPQDAAGRPSAYLVLRGRDDATVVGDFTIDQTINRGRWVSVGPYPLDNGQIAIKLINRGVGVNDRHAAAQTALSCTSQ